MVGMQNYTSTFGERLENFFERRLAIFYKARIGLPYNPVIMLLSIYPNELKTHPHKNLSMNIYSSFIHNWPKLEGTRMSFSWGMDNQAVVMYTMEYYSVILKKELSSYTRARAHTHTHTHTTQRHFMRVLLCERSPSEEATFQLYDVLKKAKL